MFSFNDALRHAERRRVFNVDGLRRLAAESVDRSPDDIVDLKKLAEGGFNRTFLITMRCGFQMVARIPYPVTVPKYFAVASEVATMAFLRSVGLPVPEIYGYSPTTDNAVGTEYVFMEFVQGTNLSDIWFDLGEADIISITRQLAELESQMMQVAFPAGGSLYYTKDLENSKVAGRPGITLPEDPRFSVGADTRLPLWFDETAEAALVSGAHKELAYLQRFGRPLWPFQRTRREYYQYKEQSPLDHVENLNRFLSIAPRIVPRDPAPSSNHFCIRHPDLQPSNIIVSGSPDSNSLRIVSLIDWQHASILPPFLHAGIPQRLQNYGDVVSEFMARPSLPENLDDLNDNQQGWERELHRRRLVHYHYVKNTEAHNAPHHAALTDPIGVLRRRLFTHASDPWGGETLALKVDLIQATEDWEALTGAGAGPGDPPCPIAFDAEDVRATMKLDAEQRGTDETFEACQNVIGCAEDGWVPAAHYEAAMQRGREFKKSVLMVAAEESEEVCARAAAHWPFDDMDEEEYM
ncbi:hypothetical protein GSI_15444 [Ganoderma sinense ZZ0214-1]|uniref:Aminoglycoside phosphotransferase domain-containing protein n=1 Tax=Ganoderma sinense ZZ0214-1 TaxID=1077348 RepID=A0A2G8RMM5_9APHY|nr:hypothetical protein GSI_15444 [Ganoderma sinense ZZ0214-1]